MSRLPFGFIAIAVTVLGIGAATVLGKTSFRQLTPGPSFQVCGAASGDPVDTPLRCPRQASLGPFEHQSY